MLGKRELDEAVANGQRNREAIQRIHNWCANAKVVCEARGMLAEYTKLPIGHHSIRCDFASDDTTSSFYEMSQAAVDFHDRNCAGCSHRKPVRLPNISEYLGERDRKVALRERAAAQARAAAAAALAERDAVRERLRQGLSPVAQTLVDDIGAFDHDRTEENRQRLMRSAQMAPEHFSDPLQDYIFAVCDTERWLDAPALEILDALGADPGRLASLAAKVLAGGADRGLAARILLPRVADLDAEGARRATAGAIDIAEPDRRGFPGRRDAVADPALLAALYGHHREAVDAAIGELLARDTVWPVEHGARGLVALMRTHPTAADPHARSLVAKYVRAELLLSDFSERDRDLHAVSMAVVGAFDARPAEVDGLLQEYLGATGTTFRERVFDLYARALRAGYGDELPRNPERTAIAFRRLLWVTTGEFDRAVMQNAVSILRDGSRKLGPVAATEIDALLSAPFLLDDRRRELERAPIDDAFPLARIERGTDLSYYRSLIGATMKLAALAAADEPGILKKLAAYLNSIPGDRELLRSLAVEKLVAVAEDVAGLGVYLPHLYRAMVGASALERAGAAAAIGELGPKARQNVPTLVLEAYVPLMLDSYVVVHKAAARAFRSSLLPDELRMEGLNAIHRLIRYYRTETGEDNFLVQCVRTLAGSADAFGSNSGAMRRYLVEVCMGADPLYVRSELRGLEHTLGSEPSFAKLVLRMLPGMVDRFNRSDEAEGIVMRLDPASVRIYQAEFEAAGVELAGNDPWLALVIVDALVRCGADGAASRVAKARVDALEDNPRNRGQRLAGELAVQAFRFEEAVAAGDGRGLADIATRRVEIEKELDARREEQRERDSRRSLPFPG